jgi:hypothetical protein
LGTKWVPCAVACLIFLGLQRSAHADFSMPGMISANSASGQFLVTSSTTASQLSSIPEIATNGLFVRLEPALLAVSAERIRDLLMEKLGLDSRAPWGGKIYMVIRPARSLDENVAIIPSRFENAWVYHVILPDTLPRDRLVRTLTSVLLLEYANRGAGERSADVPPWLVEGLAQELLAENLKETIISAPSDVVAHMPMDRLSQTEHTVDSLAGARDVLQNYSVLTFAQLSWPTEAQLSGEDGGVYRASAQLLADKLLNLRNGTAKMRIMLALLPRCYNWQTAFEAAFRGNFPTPLDTEKWWALQTVIFSSEAPGAQWALRTSRAKLDEILTVPVEYRSASNNLPTYAEVSLQSVVKNFSSTRQRDILQTKLRDLELAQFRMAPSLAVLTAEYRNALAGYLGEVPVKRNGQLGNKPVVKVVSARDTIRTLDVLDAQRRSVVVATRPGMFQQR